MSAGIVVNICDLFDKQHYVSIKVSIFKCVTMLANDRLHVCDFNQLEEVYII